MSAQYCTVAVWCPLYDSWGSLITSADGDLMKKIAERIVAILPVQARIIETETGEDEQIVPKLLKLKRPRVRNVDDPADHGFAGRSVFDEIE